MSSDCDSFFHDDVPVVNSKIIKQSGLRTWLIDQDRHSTVIRATIQNLFYKDMTSHSIYKFSWKSMTSVCIKLTKRPHFRDAPSEKADVNKYYRSGHWSAILLRPQGTQDII